MIRYSLQGAWGKDIPDKKVLKALSDFGVKLDVSARKDGLSNIIIEINDEKILGKSTKEPSTKKVTTKVSSSKKTTTKANSSKKVTTKTASSKPKATLKK